uniref:Hydroxymethylglutaryl-CoA synthase n=1 Tax=Trichobilharzia regenti TaxID=157069 RepID=A0AA85K6B9_TRIRE|nr:unnamed protein product [Trichobilharzia regenti]
METTDFGIIAMEVFFPRYFVSQHDLEVADECIGKYTQGLSQTSLGFCSIQEDINSICLTVVSNLIKRVNIDLRKVGFLEVGTETVIDKSKSTKTLLMELFETAGNFDVEGVDVKNACFGGTSALFSALNWLESSSCNGRLALVVAADIAVYGNKAARPTGGAGAVALLLGPNAPLVVDPGLRAIYMKHRYDFYKPNLSSEYPVVDGQFSMQCYREALEACYKLYKQKAASKGLNGTVTSPWCENLPKVNNSVDYMCLHSPFTRLVQKAVGWLALVDVRMVCSEAGKITSNGSDNHQTSLKSNHLNSVDPDICTALKDYSATDEKQCDIPDRQLDATCIKATESLYKRRVDPGLMFARNVGNMYTASLYSCLASLILNVPKAELLGRRILMYSYGSGMASAMFSILVHPDRELSSVVDCSLSSLSEGTGDSSQIKYAVHQRLFKERTQVSVLDFEHMLEERRISHNSVSFEPLFRPDGLFPDSYYLKRVDDRYRRFYDKFPGV